MEKAKEVQMVKETYDSDVEKEWGRLERHPVEFDITRRYLDRYIKPGDSVLDIGGGPGRYSFYLAQKGCNVTLLDLSEGNVAFAAARAKETGINIKTLCGDACVAADIVEGQFDHVLLMGPLYHLLSEADRISAVENATKLLKRGGKIFVSFISAHAGIIYAMKFDPSLLACDPLEAEYMQLVIDDKPFAGVGFSANYFARQTEILPLMGRFPLEKLHLFGQESVLAPCELNIINQPKEIYDRWVDFGEKMCEKEEFLSWSEHLMYVGRKK